MTDTLAAQLRNTVVRGVEVKIILQVAEKIEELEQKVLNRDCIYCTNSIAKRTELKAIAELAMYYEGKYLTYAPAFSIELPEEYRTAQQQAEELVKD